MIYFDNETGESILTTISQDFETGELEPTENSRKRATFKIPQRNDTTNKKITNHRLNMQHDISPIILFLMPTLFLYPVVTLIPVALEVLIHMWAHRKNKMMKNPQFYYKSPLHIYASEFCAKCREDKSMSKIGKLQDKRTMRYDYFKRILS